jgi:uncharacterized protein (DUF2267 family)
MEYQEFIGQLQDLAFIPDEKTADAAIKAVLGIFASALHEPQARRLAEKLPGPLTLDELRSHQKKVALMIPAKTFVEEIRQQFRLTPKQAMTLVNRVMHVTRTIVGEDVINDAMSVLPDDWDQLIQKA